MSAGIHWLVSTIGKRGYIADYLRAASPEGSTITGTGNERYTPGFMSCDRALVVPSITDRDYLPSVRALVRDAGITAALTVSDLDLDHLPSLRAEMEAAGIACFFPGPETAQRFLNKFETATFLDGAGILGPRTFDTLDEAIDAVGFPLVVKPRKGSASQGFGIFHDRETAAANWARIDGAMAQEFVGGRLVNVEACSAPDGTVLGLSIWERIASTDGETLLAETIEHPVARKLVLELLEASPIPGPIDIDLIETPDGLHVLEVNTRFGGGYPTSHLAGAAFPEAMVSWMAGEAAPALERYRPGIRMMKQLRPVAFDDTRVAEAPRP